MDMSAPVTQEGPSEQDLAILDALGANLSGKRQKAIDARVAAGIDRRWFEDVEAYEGRDEVSLDYAGLRATVQGYVESQESQSKKRSTLVVNVTRQKVNASSARLADIALPTDDRNWDLRPSTVPELVEQMSQRHVGLFKDGNPIMVADNGQQRQASMADLATMTMDKAKKAAAAMRDEIDDQLDISAGGCGFEGVIREMIDDRALLGVGIIKGPVITSRTKKVWVPVSDGQKTVHTLSRIQDLKPMSARVDPWDFYPHQDCGENVKKGAGTWERSRVTAGDIRHMAGIPGYLTPQLKKVLLEGPRKVGEKAADKPGNQGIVDTETIFEQWEYHGELDRESLQAAGCTCSDEDVFDTYSGCVIMINDTVIKADIEILDTEELPYDIYCVNKCSGSWAGYGDAFIARSAQKAITAGWRAMMDNAGQFVGGQIVMDRKLIEPADGKWELSGMKVWFYKGDGDASQAFSVHEIPAHQAEYAAIIKMGMEFLDTETALPMLAQGEQGTASDTASGMNLLLTATNIMQRRALKALDDQVTVPHIGRYVDWNMQYNPKPEIKGDFEVQARASGALLEQAEQNKGAANLVLLAKDPAFAHGMKKWETLRRYVKAMKFPADDYVLSDAEIKKVEDELAQRGQPGDPRIEVAKIRAEADAKIAAAELASKEKIAKMQADTDEVVAAIDERLQSTQLTSEEQQTLAKIKGTLAGKVVEVNAQKQITRDNQLLDLHRHNVDTQSKRQSDVIKKTGAEPPGKAAPGQAFTQ